MRWFLATEEARESPFGQLVHMDWFEVLKDSDESKVAVRALALTDDLTDFLGVAPSKTKKAPFVVDAVHQFDATPLVI